MIAEHVSWGYAGSKGWVVGHVANLGGFSYFAGDLLLFVVGTGNASLHQVVSSLAFLASSVVFSRYGHRDNGFALGCALSGAGMAIATIPDIMHYAQAATAVGLAVFTVSQILGIFSQSLTKAFGETESTVVKNTLGHPRMMMGMLALVSKAPMLADAVGNSEAGWTAVLILWAFGDILCGVSKPRAEPAAISAKLDRV
ncbi:MAG: hypothetical protein WDO70_10095 [Alphaproteobacteria bacterium]